MKKIALIFRNEILTTVSRVSFWVGALGIPLLGYALLGAGALLTNGRNTGLAEKVTSVISAPSQTLRIGLVDEPGLVHLPETPPYEIVPYASEAEARQALMDGQIDAYAFIPADYLASGKARYVQKKLSMDEKGNPREYLDWLLLSSLLEDPHTAQVVMHPLGIRETVSLAEAPQADMEENVWSYFVPYILGLVFYMVTLGTSTTMLNSMEREKSNRVLETLMTSATPLQILTGKILALGTVGLFQAVLWFGSTFVLAMLGARVLPAFLGDIRLPPALLWWSLLLFLLGFFFNTSIMSAAGALADSAREASQVSMIVILPAIVPIMFNTVIIDSPNSALALVLSFLPPTAPMTLVMRMAATVIPWWQPVAAALLLLLSDYLLLRAVAGVFQGQRLLGGGKVSIRRLVLALSGRE